MLKTVLKHQELKVLEIQRELKGIKGIFSNLTEQVDIK